MIAPRSRTTANGLSDAQFASVKVSMGVPAFFRWLTEKFPKVLNDVLDHPSVSLPKGGWFRRLFIRLGLVSKEELRISGNKESPEGPKRRETPPFFVAMPRGRRNKEEMTIQHMYDLFGGYGGGGGQIKTANDRKAPGK